MFPLGFARQPAAGPGAPCVGVVRAHMHRRCVALNRQPEIEAAQLPVVAAAAPMRRRHRAGLVQIRREFGLRYGLRRDGKFIKANFMPPLFVVEHKA